jgi:hypothetical protein
MSRRSVDLTGKKFNQLTVLSYVGYHNYKPTDGHTKRHKQWLCLCACGKKVTVIQPNLTTLRQKSCGCSRTPKLSSVHHKYFGSYRRGAKKRGYSFELTEGQCSELFIQDCFYCGASPSTVVRLPKNALPFLCNGIDRVDNSKGYEEGNVVACCNRCNKAKHTMTAADFVALCSRVASRHAEAFDAHSSKEVTA